MRTLRDYGGPLVLALLLHAGVFGALSRNWQSEADDTRVASPRIIQAALLTMEKPQRRKPIDLAEPPPSPPKPAAKPPPPPPKAKPKPVPTPPPDTEAERREREQAARERAEAERQQRLRELMEQSTLLALADEDVESAGQADADTMTYVAAITRAIVLEWSRPPSARNDMEARLQVDLTPAGDLLGVQIVDSSGNEAFDRSAEAAVRKAARELGTFPVPDDLSVFETHFRRLTLLFKPEDLLR